MDILKMNSEWPTVCIPLLIGHNIFCNMPQEEIKRLETTQVKMTFSLTGVFKGSRCRLLTEMRRIDGFLFTPWSVCSLSITGGSCATGKNSSCLRINKREFSLNHSNDQNVLLWEKLQVRIKQTNKTQL